MDRLQPFLCLDRGPEGTNSTSLVTAQASYLVAPHDKSSDKPTQAMVRALASASRERFGGFLLIEVVVPVGPPDPTRPPMTIWASSDQTSSEVAEVMTRHILRLGPRWRGVENRVRPSKGPFDGPRPLLSNAVAQKHKCVQVIIQVEPVWRSEDPDKHYPGVLRRVRRAVGLGMQRAAYAFASQHTTVEPVNFHSVGRRAMVKAVWAVDEQVSRIASSFDFLLCVNPINGDAAWADFQRSGFEVAPELRYRPLPIDPSLIKRQLFKIPIERIEDPTLSELFFEKQRELDRQLTMLVDRGTVRFKFGSQAAYGTVSPDLMRSAEEIFENVSATARGKSHGRRVTATQFAARAKEELAWYREQRPDFAATVEVRKDMSGGLMVSRGRLLVPHTTQTPAGRVDALIQHEIGTHLVTWHNGKSQRLKQLGHGLAGYEEFQEGLAVLAEVVVGGLTPSRLRILAGRVLIADALAGGATFVDSFRLCRRWGFGQKSAFGLVLRIYRGGGFTKDLIYLRGLRAILRYLEKGKDLAPLFVGKIAEAHVPVIQELQIRGVVKPPDLLPRYLSRPNVAERLSKVRSGLKVHQLLAG